MADRIVLEFSDKALDRMFELRELSGFDSHAAVIRCALRLYEHYLRVMANDGEVLFQVKDRTTELAYPLTAKGEKAEKAARKNPDQTDEQFLKDLGISPG